MNKILLIAEHDQQLKSNTFNILSAAQQLGGEIDILLAGLHTQAAATQAAQLAGVSRVLQAEAQHYHYPTAEDLSALVLAHAASYSHILLAATSFGKNIAPRIAALLDVAQVSDVVEIMSADTFVRPIYAGNLLATVQSHDAVKVLTIRPTAFTAATGQGTSAEIVDIPALPPSGLSQVISRELNQSERPDLGQAQYVVAGGRGLGSADNFKNLLEPLATKLNAAIGASRAAVDAGFVENDKQVGQTGTIIAPQLYIAAGISGAQQHVAGIKDAKIIVAINQDPDAAIFQIADYALVADLAQALPELTRQL